MALIKCKDCGKEISDKTKFCIHCGCPVNDNESNNVNHTGGIKINYPTTFGLVIPKLEVYFDNSQVAEIENGKTSQINIDKDGVLLFKGSFRKTKVEVKANLNYEITLTWNRITGQLVAKVDSWV